MSKSVSLNLPQVKSLMHYFGYKYVSIEDGTWKFVHKVFPGNYCFIKQRFGGSFIASIEFRYQSGHHNVKMDAAKVKSWEGLCNAVRNHTRALIFRREVTNQFIQQAA